MRKLGGAAFAVAGNPAPGLAARLRPGTVSSSLPVQAFNYLARAPGPDLHRVHVGRLLHRPAPGHLRRRPHRPLRGQRCCTEFFAITNLTTNPDPVLSAYHVAYVVWAPDTPLAEYLAARPALARGGPDAGGPGVRPPLTSAISRDRR